jgi:uroporphyrinogen-III decarboxylase
MDKVDNLLQAPLGKDNLIASSCCGLPLHTPHQNIEASVKTVAGIDHHSAK